MALNFRIGIFTALVIVQSSSSTYAQQTICEPMHPGGPEMCLQPADETSVGTRIPVLLIHGWNRARPGPPHPGIWNNFMTYAGRMPWVAEKFKFFHVTYHSNLVSVSDIGRILASLVAQMDSADPDFARQKLFIIGHSMGGLVARSFMQEWEGGERVVRLVTLATPHHGTPLANGPSRDVKAADGALYNAVLTLSDVLLFSDAPWHDYNRYDLHADAFLNAHTSLDYERFPQDANIWLDQLNLRDVHQRKTFRYGGVIHAWDAWDDGCGALEGALTESGLLDCLALLTNGLYGLWNDGIVPDLSATRLCETECRAETLFGYNHYQMAEGKSPDDSYLFGAILGNLSDMVTSDRRFNSSVVLGDAAREIFHNLRGWGGSGWDRTHGSFRSQSAGSMNYVDLFVSKTLAPHRLTFKRGTPCGMGEFYAYIRVNGIDMPLDPPMLSEEVLQCRTVRGAGEYRYSVPGHAISEDRITIGFKEDIATPIYYVRLDQE